MRIEELSCKLGFRDRLHRGADSVIDGLEGADALEMMALRGCCTLQYPVSDFPVRGGVLDHTSRVNPPQPEIRGIRLRAKCELVGFSEMRVVGRLLR